MATDRQIDKALVAPHPDTHTYTHTHTHTHKRKHTHAYNMYMYTYTYIHTYARESCGDRLTNSKTETQIDR